MTNHLKAYYAWTGLAQEETHNTYYVYVDYCNLSLVWPARMEANTAGLSILLMQMNALGYQFRYNQLNWLVETRIPIKEWEYMVYNIFEQSIMTQYAKKRPPDQWLLTKYAAFGGLAYSVQAIEMVEGNSASNITVQNAVKALTDPP